MVSQFLNSFTKESDEKRHQLHVCNNFYQLVIHEKFECIFMHFDQYFDLST